MRLSIVITMELNDNSLVSCNIQGMASSRKLQVRECTFQLQVAEGFANIRFPSSFFFELKTGNGKHHVASTNRVKADKGAIAFQEIVTLNVIMVFDLKQDQYKRKEAVVLVNLLSNSRPNDPKLVGRVTLDLAQIGNGTYSKQLTKHALEYCSVQGSITFRIVMLSHKATGMEVGQLDRSELTSHFKGVREENKSELINSSSIRSLNRDSSKLGDSTLQDRLARIKAEKMQLANRDATSSKKKLEEDDAGRSSRLAEDEYKRPTETKMLSNDMSLPVLSKNCSGLQSLRNSQGTMKNEISQNVVKLSQIPAQVQLKIQTQKQLEPSKHVQATEKGLSCRNFQEPRAEEDNNAEKESISGFEAEESNEIRQKLERQVSRSAQLAVQLQKKNEEVQALKKIQAEDKLQLTMLSEKAELYNKQHIEFQQAFKQNSLLQKEMEDLQETLSNLQIKHQQLRDKCLEKDQRILELEQNIIINQHHQNIQSDSETLTNELQQLRHQVETEQKKHEYTQLELEEVRDWFQQLQEKYQSLQAETAMLQEAKNNLENQLSLERSNLQHQLEPRPIQEPLPADSTLAYQDAQCKNLLEEKEKQVMMLMQQLTTVSDQLAHRDRQNATVNQQISRLQEDFDKANLLEKELRGRIDTLQHECEVKQLKLLQIEQDYQLYKERNSKNEHQYKQIEAAGTNKLREAQAALEDSNLRLKDLAMRMREKEESLAKLQRQLQRCHETQSQSEFAIEKYKEQIRTYEQARLSEVEKSRTLEVELKQLSRKLQRESDLSSQEIARYKSVIDQETSRRRQLERQVSQIQAKSKDDNNQLVQELQGKIAEHEDRQDVLRENLNVVQEQIKRIGDLLQEKEEREEQFSQIIVGLNQQQEQLSIKIREYQNQLNFMRERCEALEGEVELLNAYAPSEQEQNELIDLNKRLTEQKKGLLRQLQDKNRLIGQLQQDIGQTKINASQQELSNSRHFKEKNELQQRVAALSEENQKLYKEFDRVNLKFEEELEANQRINSDKITTLVRQIQQLSDTLHEKEINQQHLLKQLRQIQEERSKSKELVQNNADVEVYLNQIKELKQTNESLETKLAVLNEQYESIYSEIGEKQYQLYEATGKLKQLEDKVAAEKTAKLKEDKLQAEAKSQISLLELEIQKLRQKLQSKQRDIAELSIKLQETRNNAQTELNHLRSSQSQIQQRYRSKFDELTQQAEDFSKKYQQKCLQFSQTQAKASELELKNNQLQSRTDQLQLHISQLQQQRNNLKEQIEYLSSKEIGRTTPIHQFDESPMGSTCKIDKIDLNYTIEELNNVIAKRREEEEVEGVLRLVIQNSSRYQEESERWNRERGSIQQKAKMASRQIQKAKSHMMKAPNKSMAQKSQMTSLLKPIERVISQLVEMSQSLTEWQLLGEGEEERQKENV